MKCKVSFLPSAGTHCRATSSPCGAREGRSVGTGQPPAPGPLRLRPFPASSVSAGHASLPSSPQSAVCEFFKNTLSVSDSCI